MAGLIGSTLRRRCFVTLIGIDVGWSEKRASCGVALSNSALPLPILGRHLHADYNRIRAACLTLAELADQLVEWRDKYPEQLAEAIVVIDGPLGPCGLPQDDRTVDRQCAGGLFKGWAQPTPISHPSSRHFIAATYKLVEALGANAYVCTKSERQRAGIAVIETNPTVALATMMPRVGVEQIATRGRPLRFEGILIAAKSDWYWRNGAGRQVACALATGSARDVISKRTDHELCAALTCLALAHQFGDKACDGSGVVALGDDTGIYLLPANIDQTWKTGFPSLRFGRAKFEDHATQCSITWGRLPRQVAPEEPLSKVVPQAEQCELAKGDCCTLILADNGGAWEKHNPWLRDSASPLRVAPLNRAGGTFILRRTSDSEISGQWTLSPTSLTVAKQNGWSSDTGHLTLRDPCSIDVKILD
jgi:hypothetical protein